jgi:osmotically-inducible protein OsmY
MKTKMKLRTIAKLALAAIVLLASTAVQAAENQADWTTTLKVKLELLNKLGTDSLHVDVASLNGTVTLKGTVTKRETKELAVTIAKSVAGVKKVDNGILLKATEANHSKTGAVVGEAEAELKDAVLATKLRLALVEKMGTDGFKVGTEVANGVVTLQFDKDFKTASRDQAMALAKGVDGVSKVVSVDKK